MLLGAILNPILSYICKTCAVRVFRTPCCKIVFFLWNLAAAWGLHSGGVFRFLPKSGRSRRNKRVVLPPACWKIVVLLWILAAAGGLYAGLVCTLARACMHINPFVFVFSTRAQWWYICPDNPCYSISTLNFSEFSTKWNHFQLKYIKNLMIFVMSYFFCDVITWWCHDFYYVNLDEKEQN